MYRSAQASSRSSGTPQASPSLAAGAHIRGTFNGARQIYSQLPSGGQSRSVCRLFCMTYPALALRLHQSHTDAKIAVTPFFGFATPWAEHKPPTTGGERLAYSVIAILDAADHRFCWCLLQLHPKDCVCGL